LVRRLRREWDGAVIGPLYRDGFAPRVPYLAVTAAGTLPYFSGLPCLDMQGLNDRHIARQPAQRGHLGHDHGDGAYVLDRAPDLMVFGGARGGPPKFVSGSQMRSDPRFRQGYTMIRVEGFDPHFAISEPWVARHGQLGIEVDADRVHVPAYLLRSVTAVRGPNGRLVARLPMGGSAKSEPFDLPAGRWTVRVEPLNPRVGVRVDVKRGSIGWQAPHLILAEGARLTVALAAEIETLVAGIVFERVGA
jgi:hypothetical protein